MIIEKVTYGCNEVRFDNGSLLTGECQAISNFALKVSRKEYSILCTLKMDSINGNSLEIDVYVLYEIDSLPTMDFLLSAYFQAIPKLNEIANSILSSMTNVALNQILPLDQELVQSMLLFQLENIAQEN